MATLTSHEAADCYDYIMNTEVLYRGLGEALALLLRHATLEHRTPAKVLWRQARGVERGWHKAMRIVMLAAERDYRKCFPDDGDQPWFDLRVPPTEVLALALEQRDRWNLTK